MSLSKNLPAPVANFFQAIHDYDSAALASTFEPSAIVIDESKSFTSNQAIKEWSEEALVAHKATVKLEDAKVDGNRVEVRLIMDGDFVADYGITEPFTLYFHFELNSSGQKIQHLRIDDLAPEEPIMRAVWASRGVSKNPLEGLRSGLRRVPQVPDGWVKVKVRAVGLNYHDIFTLRGIGFHPLTFPLILGNEGAGVLEDGSEVIIYPLIARPEYEGKDVTLDPKRHVLGELTQGALAEYVVVPKANVVPKPKSLSMEEAAGLGIAWLTAYRMIFTKSGLRKGDTMLVQGSAGGVATALIQLGIAAGMTVWTTGRSEEKRAVAKRLGAHKTLEAGERMPKLVDAVFDMSGAQTLNHSIASARAGGTVVLAGIHSGSPKVEVDLFRLFTDQINLTGTYLGTKEEFQDLIKFVDEHNIRPDVALSLPLERAAEGLEKIRDGTILGKIVATV